jgi:hypothetical protein
MVRFFPIFLPPLSSQFVSVTFVKCLILTGSTIVRRIFTFLKLFFTLLFLLPVRALEVAEGWERDSVKEITGHRTDKVFARYNLHGLREKLALQLGRGRP